MKKTEIVPTCVHDDEKFAKALKTHIQNIRQDQYKAGELVHFYIMEHGQTHGKKCDTYKHITTLVPASVRSLRYWEQLYRLQDKYGSTCAGLHKLDKTAQYEIAKLMPQSGRKSAIDTAQYIPEVVKDAVEHDLNVDDISLLVTEKLRMAGKKQRKNPKDKPEEDPNSFTLADLETVRHATNLITKLSRTDSTMGKGVTDANVEAALSTLSDAVLRAYEEKTEKGITANIETDIGGMNLRTSRMLTQIHPAKRKIA